MTFEQIRIAIEGRLYAWGGAPVAYDGAAAGPSVKAAQDAKEPWVRLTIEDGDSTTACLGTDPEVRRTGLIQCQIFTDDGIGSETARQIADSLSAQLQYWRSGALETRAASAQRVGPRDGYYQLNLTVPWRAG